MTVWRCACAYIWAHASHFEHFDIFCKLLIFESQFHSISARCPIQHIGMLFPFVFRTILQEVRQKSSGL